MNELTLGMRNVSLPEADKVYIRKAFEASLKSIDLQTSYYGEQITPIKADKNFLPIHGALKKVFQQKAEKASGRVLGQTTDIEIGAILISKSGLEYEVTAKGDGFASVSSRATGSQTNVPAGESLSLLKPLPFVTQLTVDTKGIAGGQDQEGIESYRRRVLDAWQQATEAGFVEDYYRWLSRLTKAFVFPAYPIPGFVSWAGIVPIAGGDWDLPNEEVKAEISKFLETKRPPTARVTYLGEAKIIRLLVTLSAPGLSDETLQSARQFVGRRLFDRFTLWGAEGFQGQGEITEGFIRNLFAQVLGDLSFDLTLSPADKIGPGRLRLGEGILLGGVSLG